MILPLPLPYIAAKNEYSMYSILSTKNKDRFTYYLNA